jgi:hypothetical protein
MTAFKRANLYIAILTLIGSLRAPVSVPVHIFHDTLTLLP